MRRIIVTVILCLAAAFALPAHARAEVYGYQGDYDGYALLLEMRSAGWPYGTPWEAQQMAYGICSARMAGVSEDELIRRHRSYSSEIAVQVVLGSEWHFCPEYEMP